MTHLIDIPFYPYDDGDTAHCADFSQGAWLLSETRSQTICLTCGMMKKVGDLFVLRVLNEVDL